MRFLPLYCLLVAGACAIAGPAESQEAPPAATAKATVSKERPQVAPVVQETLDLLMACIENNTYTAFLVAVDDDFKAIMSEKVFKTVVDILAPRQKKGFHVLYLEELKQSGYDVHLWKLTFDDGGDDMLVKLSLKNGKVGGLLLQ